MSDATKVALVLVGATFIALALLAVFRWVRGRARGGDYTDEVSRSE